MSSATPTPRDTGLPAPTTATPSSLPAPPSPTPTPKPTILHLGDDIRWNHALYEELGAKFHIERTYSMGREDFKAALRDRRWGDFVGMYRPFWNTGGEMGNWDEELITLLPSSCRIYASAGAGFDWVDTRTLATHGIVYCNAASACTESVADTAIFLLLSTYRAFPWSFLAARSCDPTAFHAANQHIAAVTHNPNHTTLGIIGLGKIGFRLAQKAMAAFEMEIAYHDVVRLEAREKELGHVRWCGELEALLAVSDCVVLATPFEGRAVLGRQEFALFKRGARLINIARGKLVDEEALGEALDSGIISAAGLDVHSDEPNVNPKLARRDNVMVLSHTAGASVESHVGFERLGMENLISFLGGGKALTPVNLEWLVRRE
ncbi:D-mandelate dehydrogenase-like protein [Karstenula rhodostoma CBS 690.94]|uniref:D-mandelate dehydrogenase-like protein n=1 Tax=Karstenula rhodostoma CBS 690.94 TaxID=1392251 RepID=A0A9P4P9T6_9PLEO|nr:D-mandelate dehydrogenase-like protein [Karstenula rhodostoma CBS 690.94]